MARGGAATASKSSNQIEFVYHKQGDIDASSGVGYAQTCSLHTASGARIIGRQRYLAFTGSLVIVRKSKCPESALSIAQ